MIVAWETHVEYSNNIPVPHCGEIPFSPAGAGEVYLYPSLAVNGETDLSRQMKIFLVNKMSKPTDYPIILNYKTRVLLFVIFISLHSKLEFLI
jgi:hypothetical protein